MGRLQVNPVDLYLSSDQVATLDREYAAVRTTSHNTLESAASKWIGTSASALHAKLSFLQKISSNITSELEHNSRAFKHIAAAFENTDETSAENILRTRQGRWWQSR